MGKHVRVHATHAVASVTALLWPVYVLTHMPVAGFHSLSKRSRPPVSA